MGTSYSKNTNTTEEMVPPPLPQAEDTEGIIHVGDLKFEQVAQVCQSSGIKAVLANPTEEHNIQALPEGTVVLITGSGYHIANGFTPTPRGVTPAGGRPDLTVTVEQVMKDIGNADAVKIRKNPLDSEEKELLAKQAELDNHIVELETQMPDPNELSPDINEEIRAMETKLEELKTQRCEVMNQLEKLTERREAQLEGEKQKTINWLKTYAPNDPSKIRICFVREVLRKGTDEKAKPSWVSGLIKSEKGVTRVIDFGTTKVSVVDATGCFTLNEKYDENDWDIDGYIARVKEMHPDENIIARMTGKWRENLAESQELIEKLEANGIPAATLVHEKEAEYAALHTLDICAPYFDDAEHIVCQELGGGSWQFTQFRRYLVEQV